VLSSEQQPFCSCGGFLFLAAVGATAILSAGAAKADTVFVIPVIPEASTWAMMRLRFVGLGYLAYRRTVKTASAGALASSSGHSGEGSRQRGPSLAYRKAKTSAAAAALA
jgi:hypothetical protein